MFLNEYLPKELIKLFSKYQWIFDWQRAGANKRWIVLIDSELSRYYNEDKNNLNLHNFNDASLAKLRDVLETRKTQLTEIGKHINEMMDGYGDQFCTYLKTKLGSF